MIESVSVQGSDLHVTVRVNDDADPHCSRCRFVATLPMQVDAADGNWQIESPAGACGRHEVRRLTLTDTHGLVRLTLRRGQYGGDNEDRYALNALWDDLDSPDWLYPPSNWVLGCADGVRALIDPGMRDFERATDLLVYALAGWKTMEEVEVADQNLGAEEAFSWAMAYMAPEPLSLLRDDVAKAVLTPRDLVAWAEDAVWEDFVAPVRDFTMPTEQAQFWWAIGVTRPEDRPDGMTYRDAQALVSAGLGTKAQWAGAAAVCPDLLTLAFTLDKPGAHAVALGAALHGEDGNPCHHIEFPCRWGRGSRDEARDFMESVADLDWADIAACLRVGMSREAAAAHVRSGMDMTSVRVMAGLLT